MSDSLVQVMQPLATAAAALLASKQNNNNQNANQPIAASNCPEDQAFEKIYLNFKRAETNRNHSITAGKDEIVQLDNTLYEAMKLGLARTSVLAKPKDNNKELMVRLVVEGENRQNYFFTKAKCETTTGLLTQ